MPPQDQTAAPDGHPRPTPPLVLHIGHDELVLRRRYETLSILNDLLVAIWFIVGSVLFLSPDTTVIGTYLFIIGSVELAVRPLIRLSRRVHLRRVGAHESAADF